MIGSLGLRDLKKWGTGLQASALKAVIMAEADYISESEFVSRVPLYLKLADESETR